VTLRPDPLARALVTAAGVLLTLAGGWILAVSLLPPGWRVLCVLAWVLKAGREFQGFRRAFRDVDGIVINAAGGVSVLSRQGGRTPARWLTGSFASPEIAWIRLRLPGGTAYGELLIRQRMAAQDWHRLHLAWQLGQRSFGHRGPA
jgi:hypothetical protein